MNIKRIFKYYWESVKQYKIAIFSILLLGSTRILFSMIAAGYIYKNIIDTLSNNTLSVIQRSNISIWFLAAMGISFIISLTSARLIDYIFYRFLTRSIKNIYQISFKKVLEHSYNFFTNNFAGSLVTKIKRFTQSFENIAEAIIKSSWELLLAISFAFIALYLQSKALAFYLLIWCALYIFMVLFFIKSKVDIDLKWAASDSKVTGFLSDSVSNIMNVKTFSAFKKENKTFNFFVDDYIFNYVKSYKYFVIRASLQAGFMVIFHIFILYTMINLWNQGLITIGTFVMTYVYILGLFDKMWELSSVLIRFMKSMTDAKEMVDILDKEPDILDPVSPEKLVDGKGEIEFKNVNFEYVEDNQVFTNFNLKIKAGEKIGLVGHSGSGKSTITKMLLRFVDVKDGEILIDNQNIKNVTQDDLRSKISYVPQESILFHRSIGENIGYSKENASVKEIIEASKKAHAHEFISSLQNGYETLVGERGIKLSGGERQRVAIARAMLKDAPILVLDEATSSLDSISERYIQESLDILMRNKTTLVIAHRLSTIQKMDRIIVLDKGKIIEEGNHQELIAKNGAYAKLWNYQTGFLNEE